MTTTAKKVLPVKKTLTRKKPEPKPTPEKKRILKSRDVIWKGLFSGVSTSGDPTVVPVMLRKSDLIIKEIGALRLGTTANFDDILVAGAYNFNILLTSSDPCFVMRLNDRKVLIKSENSKGMNREYEFTPLDTNAVRFKTVDVGKMVPDTAVEISGEFAKQLKQLIQDSPPFARKGGIVYGGIYSSGNSSFFITGSSMYSYYHEVSIPDGFPQSLSFINSPVQIIFEDCEDICIFKKEQVYLYGKSSFQNYEVVTPFEELRAKPTGILNVVKAIKTIKPMARIKIDYSKFNKMIMDVLNSAKKEAGQDEIRITVEDNNIRIKATGYGIVSAGSMDCESLQNCSFTIENPLELDLKGVARRLNDIAELEVINAPIDEKGKYVRVLRIQGKNLTYICVIKDVLTI